MTAMSQLPPIEDLWSPTGGFGFNIDDIPSELKLWNSWSNHKFVDEPTTIMASPMPMRKPIRMSFAESSNDSCGVKDFELRCRSCGTASMLFLDENDHPVLPVHACPSLEATSSRPSTTDELAAYDASDATSLFSTPTFGSVSNEASTPSEGVGSAVSPRTAQHSVPEAVKEAVEPTLLGLPLTTKNQQAMSSKAIARKAVPEWVARTSCPVSVAMAAVYAQEESRHGKMTVPELPIAMDDSSISERDFGARSRSSTMSSTTSQSVKRKAVRPTPRWTPSEGASSSTAAPSEYEGEATYQPPVESMMDAAASPIIQNVSTATPQIAVSAEMPVELVAEPVTLKIRTESVRSVNDLVKELVISPTESHFPTAQDLTYAALAPLPPSPTASSVYSTDSYTEDEDFETPSEEPLTISTIHPYKPYKSEPLPTPSLRSPTSPLSRSVSMSPKQLKSPTPITPKTTTGTETAIPTPKAVPAPAPAIVGAAVAHLKSQQQALAEPTSATQKKWFDKPHGTEMKFKFVLTPRSGAKAATGGKKSYVLPPCDEDGRIIEPSASKSSKPQAAAKPAAAKTEEKKADEGSSGPKSTSSAAAGGLASSVSLADLARDPNELQRLLACTMFLLNDVPDKDQAPKTLDLGVLPGRSAKPGGYAMKHHSAANHEKDSLASGMRNVKWRVSMRG